MKVGDYVRTKEFGISRVKFFDNNEPILENSFTALQKEYKSSANIRDLIEENDLVKIEYYAPSYEERITRIFVVDFKNENDIAFENSHCNLNIFDNEWSKHDIKLNPVIKGIITHEQFESMEYKIKE